jgi:hypothetical protein
MSRETSAHLVVGFVVEPEKLETRFRNSTDSEFCFDGRNLGHAVEDLIDSLADATRCCITLHGDFFSGDGMVYAIEPYRQRRDSLSFEQIATLKFECERIRLELRGRFGIELDEPRVHAVWSAG